MEKSVRECKDHKRLMKPIGNKWYKDIRVYVAFMFGAMLSCGFGFVLARFIPDRFPTCELSGIPLASPGGNYEAVVIEEHCSAIDRRITRVVIRKSTFFNWPPILRDQQIVFTADVAPEDVYIEWTSARNLLIQHRASLQPLVVEESWKHFRISVEYVS